VRVASNFEEFAMSIKHSLAPQPRPGHEFATLGGGCFWCLEAVYEDLEGVVDVESGYAGGQVAAPTYEQVCGGRTGHAEVVRVEFDPARISYREILEVFFVIHDPTTLNRQGNDIGTAYRSAIWWTTEGQENAARATFAAFQDVLTAAGRGEITTTLGSAADAGPFWYAEDYHQQYLHKNPGGYCNHGPNGLTCPVGVADLPAQTQVLPPA
jgi:peptide-methionine (S)-S-oxide reductase